MLARLRSLYRTHDPRYPRAVLLRWHVGVGVNSGCVMSGTVGGGGRPDFTVIGDVVNTVARIARRVER